MKRLCSTALLATLAASRWASAEDTAKPEDFAFGIEVTPIDDASPIQTLLIPQSAYRETSRPDLGDVRVYDAKRTPVPFARRSLAPPNPREHSVTVDGFPLLVPANQEIDALSMRIERDPSGRLTAVANAAPTEASPELQGYLFDLGSVADETGEIRGVAFDLSKVTDSFVSTVRIDSSKDLTNWQTASYAETLARIDFAGRTLTRDRFPLTINDTRYLRMTWGRVAPAIESPSLQLLLTEDRDEPERERAMASGTRVEDDPHAYEFDLEGPMPADRIRIRGLIENSLAEARLLSRADEKSEWTERDRSLIYSITVEGTVLESPAIALSPTRDRYWRLEVEGKGGGLADAVPVLEFEWVPEQLVFMRRGPPPFLFAFGSGRAEPVSFNAEELLSVLPP
ncbi:MAG: DUF3999 domain-containing protein, partial [Myxococcota bacterium]